MLNNMLNNIEFTIHEKDQIIEFLNYYMGTELRHRLMRELPQAYNHMVGSEVVQVLRTRDGVKIE